jgi:hypothetical protein
MLRTRLICPLFLAAFVSFPFAHGQYSAAPRKLPELKGLTVPDEPTNPQPAALDFHDPKYKLSMHIPAGWNFEKKDGALSDFAKEVRSAPRGLDVRGVASINYNPYPPTTFAGATFYYSVMPKSDSVTCAAMATAGKLKPQKDVVVAGKPFKHGQDSYGTICTEARDEVYTALQGKSCLRFDLVINTFCHASSGALEISPKQINDIDGRMAKMLDSIRLE